MLLCNRGQIVKFSYRKQLDNGMSLPPSSAQYKGKIFNIIPTPNGRDIMVEMCNGNIRRFHANQICAARNVGIVERVLDWFNNVQYNRPIV